MQTTKVKKVFVQGPVSAEFIADSISKHSKKYEIGAHSIFLGQVREDLIGGKKVESIVYSAYEEMAEQTIHEIREAAIKKHSLTCLHVYHSLGNVRKGEICLFVFTSSIHRNEAIQACEEIVEAVKSNVPIWGKEILEDNSAEWKKENL